MKTLFVIATLTSVGPTSAHVLPAPMPGHVDGVVGDVFQHMAEQRVTVAFPQPVSINGASVVVTSDQATIFIDPVGSQAQYSPYGRPDIVILTRAHPDHLSNETMIGMLRRDTVVLAPQAVINQLPLMISNNVIAPFDAGTSQVVDGIRFSATPATSDIPSGAQVYPRDRGDIGVVIEIDGARVYF